MNRWRLAGWFLKCAFSPFHGLRLSCVAPCRTCCSRSRLAKLSTMRKTQLLRDRPASQGWRDRLILRFTVRTDNRGILARVDALQDRSCQLRHPADEPQADVMDVSNHRKF